MNIIIKKNILIYKGYKLKCSIGKSGTTKSKKEGDFATPKGVFKLGKLYFRKDRNKNIVSKLRKKVIKKNMGWCNDTRSRKYNKATNNYKPTECCVSLLKKDFLKIIPLINKNTKISIIQIFSLPK